MASSLKDLESENSSSSSTESPVGTVVLVDDERPLLKSIDRILKNAGWRVIAKDDPLHVLPLLENPDIDLVLTDVRMPGMTGVELCRQVKEKRPDIEVVVMTAVGSIDIAVEAMKAGAYEFLTKPFECSDVVTVALLNALERKRLTNRNRFLETQLDVNNRFENIIGSSARMKKVFRLIESVANSDTSVLIQGESGTGKELAARAIHERSERQKRPFLAVNCSAFTETLLESELFGHMRGAFTGATNFRKGLFEEANGGTLFLDEIGEMVPSLQSKVLRAIQEGEIKPVGSNEIRKVDVRIIAATNMDLPSAVKSGTFREDLYYRIDVVRIDLPPLRDREDDIPMLIQHFFRKHAKRMKKNVTGIESSAQSLLRSYRWPGNVRQLENVIERAVVLTGSEKIQPEDLPESISSLSFPNSSEQKTYDMPFSSAKKLVVAGFEKKYVEDALSRSGGVIAEAARLAGLDRSNFRRLMNRYEVDAQDFRID